MRPRRRRLGMRGRHHRGQGLRHLRTSAGALPANNCGGTISAQSLLYGIGGFNSVAVDANENLYAMDPVNSRAIVFPNAGSLSGSLTATAGFRTGRQFHHRQSRFRRHHRRQSRLRIDFQCYSSARRHSGGQFVRRLYRRYRQQSRAGIRPAGGAMRSSNADADGDLNRINSRPRLRRPTSRPPLRRDRTKTATATATTTVTTTPTATATARKLPPPRDRDGDSHCDANGHVHRDCDTDRQRNCDRTKTATATATATPTATRRRRRLSLRHQPRLQL